MSKSAHNAWQDFKESTFKINHLIQFESYFQEIGNSRFAYRRTAGALKRNIARRLAGRQLIRASDELMSRAENSIKSLQFIDCGQYSVHCYLQSDTQTLPIRKIYILLQRKDIFILERKWPFGALRLSQKLNILSEWIMPQSKGRVPSHQNAFAFRHNPKSKLTEKIAAMPIRGLCRRCRDKIEWSELGKYVLFILGKYVFSQ